MKAKIQVINESTVTTDEQVKAIVDALQIQVSRDFAPIWNTDAELSFVPKGAKPDEKEWWVVVLDDSDQAGALGYHDLTSGCLPIGKVFAKSDLQFGSSLSVTISHELLEMLGDPWICDLNINYAGTTVYCRENCDACEDDSFGYEINGVLVSDFVTPQWFVDAPGTSGPFDFRGHISKPFEVLKGGYIGYLDLTNSSRGWQEITVDGRDVAASKPEGSRYERRKRFRMNGKRQISTR